MITVHTLVGVGEPLLSDQIEVFPNPTTGKIYLRFNLVAGEDTRIEAYDMLGRLVVQEQQNVQPNDILELNLSEAAAGIYLLKVSIGEEVMTKTVSVKR